MNVLCCNAIHNMEGVGWVQVDELKGSAIARDEQIDCLQREVWSAKVCVGRFVGG